MYLDCPPGMGLHCPDSTHVAAFESAVTAGDITWYSRLGLEFVHFLRISQAVPLPNPHVACRVLPNLSQFVAC